MIGAVVDVRAQGSPRPPAPEIAGPGGRTAAGPGDGPGGWGLQPRSRAISRAMYWPNPGTVKAILPRCGT